MTPQKAKRTEFCQAPFGESSILPVITQTWECVDLVDRGLDDEALAEARTSEQETGGKTHSPDGACTFICSRGTLDGAYPSLMLAINARRQGMEATIFYTFMGINVIRKDRAGNCKFIPAGTVGAIPGMASVATWMMKRQIGKAGVPTVEELLEMAQYLSVFRPGARLGTWIWLRTGQLVIASSFSAISSFVRNTQVLDSE